MPPPALVVSHVRLVYSNQRAVRVFAANVQTVHDRNKLVNRHVHYAKLVVINKVWDNRFVLLAIVVNINQFKVVMDVYHVHLANLVQQPD